MDLEDLDIADTPIIQSYIALFCTLARVDTLDDELYLYPMNKLVSTHGVQTAFAVYAGLALLATERLDLVTMEVDANPIRIVTAIQNKHGSHTPADLADDETAQGTLKAAEFIGHMAANDGGAAFTVIDKVFTSPTLHPGTNEPCSCQAVSFIRSLAEAALTGPRPTKLED